MIFIFIFWAGFARAFGAQAFDDNCQKFDRVLMVSLCPAQDWSAGLSGHITVDLKEASLFSSSTELLDLAFLT